MLCLLFVLLFKNVHSKSTRVAIAGSSAAAPLAAVARAAALAAAALATLAALAALADYTNSGRSRTGLVARSTWLFATRMG